VRYFSRLDPFKRQEGVFCKTSFRRSIAGLNILEAVYDGGSQSRAALSGLYRWSGKIRVEIGLLYSHCVVVIAVR